MQPQESEPRSEASGTAAAGEPSPAARPTSLLGRLRRLFGGSSRSASPASEERYGPAAEASSAAAARPMDETIEQLWAACTCGGADMPLATYSEFYKCTTRALRRTYDEAAAGAKAASDFRIDARGGRSVLKARFVRMMEELGRRWAGEDRDAAAAFLAKLHDSITHPDPAGAGRRLLLPTSVPLGCCIPARLPPPAGRHARGPPRSPVRGKVSPDAGPSSAPHSPSPLSSSAATSPRDSLDGSAPRPPPGRGRCTRGPPPPSSPSSTPSSSAASPTAPCSCPPPRPSAPPSRPRPRPSPHRRRASAGDAAVTPAAPPGPAGAAPDASLALRRFAALNRTRGAASSKESGGQHGKESPTPARSQI
eukprot:tig00021318_g20175.t1